MTMSQAVAEQIANLLNSQNCLTMPYTATKVLEHQDRYIIRLDEKSKVLGAVEVKKVQWNQCEIDHLSVHPEAKRQGIGTLLLLEAEAKAKQLGARVTQCTIKIGNEASEGLFRKQEYSPTVTFLNEQSGNRVTVYQKVLISMPEESA